MSAGVEGLDSPSRAGNFVIACSQEEDIVKNIQTDSLVQYLDSKQNSSASILSQTDKSFYPRAFTDFDLIEQSVELSSANKSSKADNQEKESVMAFNNGQHRNGYQPDVIVSNSHQRAGPDGSPALVSSKSQGFIPSANLSETGELFAPVRTLTFSDIDQSSQIEIEDSYVNNSRLVSTPNKSEGRPNYDYNSMYNGQRNLENNEYVRADCSDTSDSDNVLNGNESPMFRQLEGEADNDLGSSGPFHPSSHGLSKEFMDNFVGKTGNQAAMCENGDIFSPLASNPFAERHINSVTPPLHSPGPNSPYAKKFQLSFSKRSPGNERSPRGRPSPKGQAEPSNDDEIQFAMSPTKSQSELHPFDRDMLALGNQNLQQQKQVFLGQEKLYVGKQSSAHCFQPIEKHPQSFNPASVPKNLDEYFEQVTSDEYLTFSNTKRNQQKNTENDLDYRQGDGIDHHGEVVQQRRFGYNSDSGNQYSAVSPSSFEHRYLQRTQVSVKLPQATYDTISANSSHDEKFAAGDRVRNNTQEMPDIPPDVAVPKTGGKLVVDNSVRETSPGKVMDLLENQVSKLKDTSNDADNGSRDNGHGVKNTGDNIHYNHTNAKAKDTCETGKTNVVENVNVKNDNGQKVNQGMSEKNDQVHVSAKVGIKGQGHMSQSLIPATKQSQGHVYTKQSQSFQMGSQSQAGSLVQSGSHPESASQAQSGSQAQLGSQSQVPVPSRLLQETVSQRNKTTQKFVSSAPSVTKPVTTTNSLNKEFKKPLEVAPKSLLVASSGARKPGTNENAAKFKVSDKTKPKSVSTESLNNKQKPVLNQSKDSNKSTSQEKMTQSRYHSQCTNQSGSNHQEHNSRIQPSQNYQGHSRGEGRNGSMHSVDDECQGQGRIVTQVETTSPVAVEQPKQTARLRQGSSIGDSSLDIKGMEEVRQQLQGMMRLSHDHMTVQDRSKYEHSDILAGFGVEFGEHHKSFDNSWNAMRKQGEDDMMDNFPSFTSQYFTDSGNISRSDASVHAENQRLRDMLEKERYRRKHCEQYIQQLNVKILEAQQQLAVAVSTDKRKDIMIEQLDKQLARVMEGWKKRDQEKDAFVEEIQKEKEEIENNLKQQQEMISNFEHDMSAAVDALRQEKETAAQHADELHQQIQESERAKNHAEEMVEAEKEKGDLLQQECDNLREARENLDKKLDQMQRRLHREQDEWFQREQELLQRIEEVSEKSNKILTAERVKNEEQGKLAEEIMDQYQAANTAVKKMEMELDAALREKESLKVEMGIMEAKFENAQRVLEADMHSTMEKQIAEQIADVQRRHEKSVNEVNEKHREQMLELSQKNGKEMERQMSVFRDEMHKKEDEYRKQIQELEARLMEYRNENAELKRSKQKLESTRLEILTKLQYAMQTQWNEALSLLSATPQRQPTQRRTPAVEDDSVSTISTQSAAAVNFSLCSPNRLATNQNSSFKPVTNQNTPPRSSTNQNTSPRPLSNQNTPPRQSANGQSPSRHLANELSPVLRHVTQFDRAPTFSPGGESMVSHSTEKDPGDQAEAAIETAAMSHLKQFQDYMNSFTKTPEWISTINSQLEPTGLPPSTQVPSNIDQWTQNRLPSPPELAALLSTHLHNIQQQQMMSHPPVSINQSETSFSQPNSLLANQKHSVSLDSQSLPANLNFPTARGHNVSNVIPVVEGTLPAAINHSQSNFSHINGSVVSESNVGNYSLLSEKGGCDMWERGHGMSQAVPLHPPKQGEDPHTHENQGKLAGFPASHVRGYFQGGQSFSPPTKQNKDTDSLEDESSRLNQDYSQLSEKLMQHESHQQELQHYIHMLLKRSPGEVSNVEQNDSMFSQDNKELDLNDTAQAAQLQKELDRIQELRQKQENSNKQRSAQESQHDDKASAQSNSEEEPNKILSQDQLAEVTKLLNQVKGQGHGQSSNPHVAELLELLKHAQINQGNQPQERKRINKTAAGNQNDRHKGPALGIRRNVQFNPGKGVDASKSHTEGSSKTEKAVAKPNAPRKIERKVANPAPEKKVPGSATKPEKGPKPAAWK